MTVGDGVFEAVKVVDGQPFALSRHLVRLARSATGLGLPAIDEGEVRRGVEAVLDAQHLPLGRLRITYTGGEWRQLRPAGTARRRSSWWRTPCEAGRVHDVGGHRALAPQRAGRVGRVEDDVAENVVALAYAQERGATEAVFANLAGHLCEGTGSNVFYVVGGELRTPTLAAGCLAGISRALLLEWYGGREVDEPVEVLADADEIFLVSATETCRP